VAEGARLESVYTGNRIVGSNPTPSATPKREELASNILQFLVGWFDLATRRETLLLIKSKTDGGRHRSPFAA
jgi:hypothetical protein